MLLDPIQPIFERSRGPYGSPRVLHALARAGVRVSRRRVARLMRQAPTTTACACTPESVTLHRSSMRRERDDRTPCLPNRGRIPAFGRG